MKYGLFSTIQSLFGYNRLEFSSAEELLEFARARSETPLDEGYIVPAEFRCFFDIAKIIAPSETVARKENPFSAVAAVDQERPVRGTSSFTTNGYESESTHYAKTKDPLAGLANALYDFTSAEESQYALLDDSPKSNDGIMNAIELLQKTYKSDEHTALFNQLASITSNTSVNFATDIACR